MASGKPSNPMTWNRYAYALNNPLKFIDPTGYAAQNSQKPTELDPQKTGRAPECWPNCRLPPGHSPVIRETVTIVDNAPPQPAVFTDPAPGRGLSLSQKLMIMLGLGGAGAAVAGGAGGAGGTVGPGTFTALDIALGVHEFLPGFKGEAMTGTMWNTDAYPALPGETLVDGIFRLIDDTVAAGGEIRFNLDGVDTVAAFDPTSDKYNTVTSRELRYVVEKHRDSVRFYEKGGNVEFMGCGCEP